MTQGSTVTTYQYDANNNRLKMTKTGVGTTTSDAADVTLVSKTDPNGKVTTYTYDLVNGKSNGNLVQAVYDPGGTGHLNQTTPSTYDTNNRLNTVQLPSGTLLTFTYDAEGHRISKTVTSGGTTTVIQDVYALGHLAYQTDGAGNKLATFTYAANGVPSSVVIGSGTSTPRYYYVYTGHGDVVALVDSVGTVVASYSYDAFGNLTASSETLPNGWSNPYRYDGAEGVRYDVETGLYWLSVRAYDPTLGRFLSHDPLGRLAAWGVDFQPYGYASNNPVVNTDPTGLVSCPIRIDGQCQSYWNTAPPDAPDIDGCSKPHPCSKPATTTPPPGNGSGGSTTTTTSPACDSQCLNNGKRILSWLSKVATEIPMITASILDLITWIPAVGIAVGGNAWGAVIAALIHIVRDVVTAFDAVDIVFEFYPAALRNFLHAAEAALDILSPIADILSYVFFWGTPKVLQDLIKQVVDGALAGQLKRWGRTSILPKLLKWFVGGQAPWILQGLAVFTGVTDPATFCEKVDICHITLPSYVH